MLLVAAADSSAAVRSIGVWQKEHSRIEVLMVSLQFGQGKTLTAEDRLKLCAMTVPL